METLYGKYPKHITCECNAEEMNEEAITIGLNDRCPICNKLHQVCVTKPEVKMKQVQEPKPKPSDFPSYPMLSQDLGQRQ